MKTSAFSIRPIFELRLFQFVVVMMALHILAKASQLSRAADFSGLWDLANFALWVFLALSYAEDSYHPEAMSPRR